MYSTRTKVLLAFDRSPRLTLSGELLARRLGLTRASVWKHIRALRAEGYPIHTRKASGYGLTSPFDFSLLKGEASRHVRFWKIHYHLATRSTQELAKYAADQGAAEGNVWITEKQSAGRGRLERSWESPLGGLWMSVLLRPAIPPGEVPSLTLVAALALADAIQSETNLPVRLKWPNDIVVKTPSGWRKVSGILTEMSAEIDRTHWVVLGVGVNVNNHLSRALTDRAVSLATLTGRSLSRARLVRSFFSHFGKAYRRFEKTGFENFRASYWNRYSRPGEAVELKTAQGLVRGIARGVDARGALVVESRGQTKSIWVVK